MLLFVCISLHFCDCDNNMASIYLVWPDLYLCEALLLAVYVKIGSDHTRLSQIHTDHIIITATKMQT